MNQPIDFAGPEPVQRKRVQFDPTINLGHILTFVGFMLAGFGAWGNIDKRITLTEVQATAAIERTNDQDKRMGETLKDLRTDIKDVRQAVNDINRTLAMAPGKK
ncbi:MAG: hypothetical protein I8H71_00375 [Xanthomonadaceae bacterium]|nr:hypothetical protein [Xanthomonadaceae bacterium]MBH2008128.1 hypothetical protein [Xanthomonadaceae bacterium]